MKILVIMGGSSPEREVSLNSGQAIYQACLYAGYETDQLIIKDDIGDHIDRLQQHDLVFNALHGGQGENGVVQGFLDSINVRYTGSGTLSSAICMDKAISKKLVRLAGYDTADWEYIDPKFNTDKPGWSSFPAVVKPNDLGSTIGLSIVQSVDNLPNAIRAAGRHSDEIMIEKFIDGREITVAVLGDTVLPVVEIVPTHAFYDYECKYTAGKSEYGCPADIPSDLAELIQASAGEIYRTLKCAHYARIDFRLDYNNRFWFLEANTLPGMTATSLVPKAAIAAGITFDDLINKIIMLACNV